MLFVISFVDILALGGGRTVDLFKEIFNQKSFSKTFFLLINESGHRLISIYSSWLYSWTNPFGGGIGNWEVSSAEALRLTGIDLSKLRYFILHGNSKAIPIRSSGFIPNLVLDTGIIGFFVFVMFLFSTLRKYWNNNPESKNIMLIFFFKILFIGSVGTPVAWITTAISLKYLYNKKIFENERE